mmetsp:Transcript_3954/g.4492  ORF Transcript_3954/g.4492 Transcript_3954/m.4492 type:complete len:128 (+) Transcript_3954:737-1120(+)
MGKDPPGTPWIIDQFRRYRDTYLVSPFLNIHPTTPDSERIAITSTHMNPTPLNVAAVKTVTAILDDREEVVLNVPLTPASSTPPRPPIDNQDEDVYIVPLTPVSSIVFSVDYPKPIRIIISLVHVKR